MTIVLCAQDHGQENSGPSDFSHCVEAEMRGNGHPSAQRTLEDVTVNFETVGSMGRNMASH